MQNKNRKEARLEVVFREVEKVVICNSSRYLMTIFILVTMATCKANSNKDISFSLPEPPKNQKTRIAVVMAALRVCLTFMRKRSASGETNARELNPVKL